MAKNTAVETEEVSKTGLSISDVVKKINRSYKDNSLIVKASLVPHYKKLSTGDLGFDYPLQGGIPEGRIITFSGVEHSGKTTAACAVMAKYQEAYPDKKCVYVDVEHSLDLQFQSKMTGLDLDKLYYVSPNLQSGEKIFDMILQLQAADDIGLIVLDSIPALISERDLESDMEKDTGRAGGIAKSLHKFTKAMVDEVAKRKNNLIYINQVRVAEVLRNGAIRYSEPGGKAPDYYSSIKIRFGKRTFIDGDKEDLSDGTNATGFRLKFAITKNKTGNIARGGGWISFDYEKGIDYARDALQVAINGGYISRPTSMTYEVIDLNTGELLTDAETGEDLKFTGKAKLFEYFYSHPEFTKKYSAMLNEYLSNSDDNKTLLDKETLDAIIEEENSVTGDAENDSSFDDGGAE